MVVKFILLRGFKQGIFLMNLSADPKCLKLSNPRLISVKNIIKPKWPLYFKWKKSGLKITKVGVFDIKPSGEIDLFGTERQRNAYDIRYDAV